MRGVLLRRIGGKPNFKPIVLSIPDEIGVTDLFKNDDLFSVQ